MDERQHTPGLEVWTPADDRVRCVNCRWLEEGSLYTFCGNDNGPIGHVNFGCGDEVTTETKQTWCAAFEPQEWLAKQGNLLTCAGMADPQATITALREALTRLGSMEAFGAPRAVGDSPADEELLLRVDYARAAIALVPPATGQEK